ncbi:MAG TPA: response regulator, partial [Desulfomicrobiaceae bacterium]|nr:response regulator [Desulfomicrobiaceae bacterium]
MSERILIIDDEEDIRFSLSGVLEDEGFLVSEAGDGSEGLAFLRQNEVGLVFLDIWMPGMDGMAVLDEIRVRFPDLPVIMISGHGTIETAVKAIKKGAYDFIEKPLSLENVLITVNKALEFSSLKQENRVLRSRIRDSHVQRVTGAADSVVQLRRMIA